MTLTYMEAQARADALDYAASQTDALEDPESVAQVRGFLAALAQELEELRAPQWQQQAEALHNAADSFSSVYGVTEQDVTDWLLTMASQAAEDF